MPRSLSWGSDLSVPVGCWRMGAGLQICRWDVAVIRKTAKFLLIFFLDNGWDTAGNWIFLFLKLVGTTVIAAFCCRLSNLTQGNTVTPLNLCRISCESCFHEILDECFHYLRQILWFFSFFPPWKSRCLMSSLHAWKLLACFLQDSLRFDSTSHS